MQCLGPTAKLQHLSQNCNFPFRWFFAKHVNHALRRFRVGIVAIVQDRDSTPMRTLPTHLAGPELRYGF